MRKRWCRARLRDMDLDSRGVMSQSTVKDDLSRVVAGQLVTTTGAVPLAVAPGDAANSVPGSDAHVDAVKVAHFVFAPPDQTIDVGVL